MNGLPTVAVLHAPGGAATIPEIVRAARGVCRTHLVFRAEVAALNPRLVQLAAQLGDYTVLDDDTLPAGFTADACLTFADSQLDHADALATQLGHVAPRVTAPWDKLMQRTALRAAGLSTASAVPVDTSADLVSSAEALGFPFVVKPRRGVGGRGVRVIRDANALALVTTEQPALAHHVAESWHAGGGHPAEDPVLGDFVSVEMVSAGGRHRPVTIFDKLPVILTDEPDLPGARVTGDLHPTRLSADLRHDVIRLVTSALNALGVTNRLTHTEVKLTRRGPEVIEVNGRMGGDLARLLAVTAGPNLVRAALLASLGVAGPEEPVTSGPAAAGFYPGFAHGAGTVTSEVSRSTVLRLPDVVRVDHVASHGRPRTDVGGRAVDVVIAASDAEELGHAVARTAVAVTELFAHDELASRQWFAACAEVLGQNRRASLAPFDRV